MAVSNAAASRDRLRATAVAPERSCVIAKQRNFQKNLDALVYWVSNTHVSLAISILPASDVPIFRQVMQQVQLAVAVGRLEVGDQVPAVRVLAEVLVINPNTVARAYQELIRDGVLESRQGRGVFVAQRRQVFSEEEQGHRLRRSAEQLCHEAILLGADLPDVKKAVEAAWKNLRTATQDFSKPPNEKI